LIWASIFVLIEDFPAQKGYQRGMDIRFWNALGNGSNNLAIAWKYSVDYGAGLTAGFFMGENQVGCVS